MIASYTFNSQYRPNQNGRLPSLRLLEGGRFTPGQYAPCLIYDEDNFRLRYFQWGLSLSPQPESPPAELDHTLPACRFLQHLRKNPNALLSRCIIPSDAFYDTSHSNGHRRQLKYDLRDKQAFCFAGLYKRIIQDDGAWGQAFVILTTQNLKTGEEQPLVIRREWEHLWLSPSADLDRLSHIVSHSGNGLLSAQPVRELLITNSGYREPVAA